MTCKVSVIGPGAWGTALCIPLCQNSNEVWLWGKNASNLAPIVEQRENSRHLPGVTLPGSLKASTDAVAALSACQVAVVAVPTHAIREVLREIGHLIPRDAIVVSAAKGIEPNTHLRMTQVIESELKSHPSANIACISGPNFAVEVARGVPSATVVGAHDPNVGHFLQDVFMTCRLRVYTNPDVAGVELGGALKNIVALTVGITEGMGLGYNTRAALITRGLAEMARLGMALGASPLTFAGLSGMGDLVLTCTGEYSRNRQCGLAIGRGESLTGFMERTGLTVEGVRTTVAANELAQSLRIDLPITQELYEVLFAGTAPADGLEKLMTRDKKHEIEEVASYR